MISMTAAQNEVAASLPVPESREPRRISVAAARITAKTKKLPEPFALNPKTPTWTPTTATETRMKMRTFHARASSRRE